MSFTADLHRDNITQRNGADWVTGGQSWYVGGQIKNLSSHQSLCLAPLFAQADGNAISTGLQDVSEVNANTEERRRFAGLMKPGQSFPLGMLVRTSSTGGTQGSVAFEIKAFKADPGASCQVQLDGKLTGAGAALTADEMNVQKESTSYVVHVDVSVNPDPTPSAGYLNFFGGFAKGSFDFYGGIAQSIGAVAKWAYNNPDTYLKLASAFTGNPIAQADLLERMNEHVMAVSSLIVNYLQTVVPGTGENPFEIAAQRPGRTSATTRTPRSRRRPPSGRSTGPTRWSTTTPTARRKTCGATMPASRERASVNFRQSRCSCSSRSCSRRWRRRRPRS